MRASYFLSMSKIQCRLLAASLAIFLSFGTSGLAFAQSSWFGLREEPVLISVSGTLHDTSTISVHAFIDGQDTALSGHTARAFLYLRSYIIYDDDAGRWRTTEKYKVWKNEIANSSSQVVNLGNGITFTPGSLPKGAKTAECFGSDGRNKTCRDNKCIAPLGKGNLYCYWRVQGFDGKYFKILGTNGKRIP